MLKKKCTGLMLALCLGVSIPCVALNTAKAEEVKNTTRQVQLLAEEAATTVENKNLEAGNLIGDKPSYVTDTNVTYKKMFAHGKEAPPYGYVSNPAFTTISQEKLPNFKLSEDGKSVLAQKILFSLHLDTIKASDYSNFEMTYLLTDWQFGEHQFYFYPSGTATFMDESGNPTGYIGEAKISGPETKQVITLDPSALADKDGNINDILILYWGNTKDTADTIVGLHNGAQLWINEVNFKVGGSLRMSAGNLVGDKPSYVQDDSITFGKLSPHGKFGVYGYVESAGLSTVNDEKFPNLELYNDGKSIKAQKLAWTLHTGGLKATDYAQFQMTFYWTDWDFGEHQFYIYPSGTTKFADEEGNPTGYVSELKVAGPETRQKITINDMAGLADSEGNIDDIIIVYWGNTKDTKDNVVGCFKGTQIWVNEVNFLVDEDVVKEVISEEYVTKDITEILPIGEGWNINMKTSGIQSGEKGFGAYTLGSSTEVASYDQLTFTWTPNFEDNYSAFIALKAASNTTKYDESGMIFWFANDNITIGAGKTFVSVKQDQFPEGTFVNGSSTVVTISAIPYYVDGVQSGYYMAVNIGDAKEPIISLMMANKDLKLGSYTNVVMQDLGKDYGIKISGKGAPIKTAQELMNVTLSSSKTEYTKPRASLEFNHMKVEGEVISDLEIKGDATFDKNTGMLTFNKPGEVTVSYKVTNAFGEFKSNELTLKYVSDEKPVTPDKPEEPKEEKKGGCGSIIGGTSLVLISLVSAGAAIALKRRKR